MTKQETFDKKQQKLERMEKIAWDAVRLKDAIKSEVDLIMQEIDAEINPPKNAKSVFWDGKQPHYWDENERCFRKATKCDIGKNVIVCSWDDPSPLSNLENQALLEHITQFDDFTVRSTNGSRLCHFPIAWVECVYLDATFEDVPHICVFANTILAKQADKPEEPDPLIDEESFLKPEPGTVSEHIADANKKVPPAGYRLLDKSAKSETRKAGDLFWSRTARKWMELVDDSVEYANRDDWPACRQIEEPVEEPETIARCDSEGRDVTEMPGLWTEGDTQYREPTQSDLVNGPIEVEVCDDSTCDLNWEKRQLYAILPEQIGFRYICQNPFMKGSAESWKHSRIKVEG